MFLTRFRQSQARFALPRHHRPNNAGHLLPFGVRGHGRKRPLQHRQHHSPRRRLGSGAEKRGSSRALGRSRGGFTSKLHCLADALGRPHAFDLTVREAADSKVNEKLIALPEPTPNALLADKGYDADAVRANLAQRKIEPVIPGRSNRSVKIE